MTDMRTPLGKVRGLGSAKEGTDHFWKQRLTAVSNLILICFLVCLIIGLVGDSHGDVVKTLSSPIVSVLLLASVVSICWHMKLGMQTVIEDYVYGEGAKVALVIANNFFCVGLMLAGAFAALKLGFGG